MALWPIEFCFQIVYSKVTLLETTTKSAELCVLDPTRPEITEKGREPIIQLTFKLRWYQIRTSICWMAFRTQSALPWVELARLSETHQNLAPSDLSIDSGEVRPRVERLYGTECEQWSNCKIGTSYLSDVGILHEKNSGTQKMRQRTIIRTRAVVLLLLFGVSALRTCQFSEWLCVRLKPSAHEYGVSTLGEASRDPVRTYPIRGVGAKRTRAGPGKIYMKGGPCEKHQISWSRW